MSTEHVGTAASLAEANAHFVTDRIAVGGDLDRYDEGLSGRHVEALVAAGITHLLDVREKWFDEKV